jgi:hypothetical protein
MSDKSLAQLEVLLVGRVAVSLAPLVGSLEVF